MISNSSINPNMNSRKAGIAYSGQSIISENTDTKQYSNMVEITKLSVGDYFRGNITDIQNGIIKILLGGDQTFTAKIDTTALNDMNFSIGQTVFFQVTDNVNGKIAIKPLVSDKYSAELLLKALEGAGLSPSEKNITIVKGLIDNGMPIDKNTLNLLANQVSRFPNGDVEDIISLHKLSVAVTEENLEMYKNYTNYNNSMSAEITRVANDIFELFGNNDFAGKAQLNNAVLEALTSMPEEQITMQNNAATKINENNIVSENAINTDFSLNENIMTANSSETTENKVIFSLADSILQEAAAESKNISQLIDEKILQNNNFNNNEKLSMIKYIFNNINENNPSAEILNDIESILNNKDYGRLIKENIRERLLIDPKKFLVSEEQNKEIRELYERIDKFTDKIEKTVANQGEAANRLAEHCSELKNNVTFIEDLNQNNAYVQLPVRFSEDSGNGELYVYNRKRGMVNNNNEITAFLHFDLNSLGATDIYVSMKSNAVNIKFSLDNEDSVKLVNKHISELSEALEKKGYSTTLKVEQTEKISEAENAFKIMQEENSVRNVIKRYSFDIRT